MALFKLTEDGYADNVVCSAVALQNEVLVEYNKKREEAGYTPVRIGVGINTGMVATGIAGTPERMDACAFGTTVNVAARCEKLTKDFNTKIIITEYTYSRLSRPDLFRITSLGEQEIRGLEQKVHLYGVFPSDES